MTVQILSAVGSIKVVVVVTSDTGAAGDGGGIVIEWILLETVAVLDITTSGGTKSVQLGGQLGL